MKKKSPETVDPWDLLNAYAQEFVRQVTSDDSNFAANFVKRVEDVDMDCNAPLLLTSALGLGGESGEFEEIVKKIFFHGKNIDKQTKAHLKKELGDIIWYWANACRALSLLPSEVIEQNIEKLQERYPGGEFDQYLSEHRKEGDI